MRFLVDECTGPAVAIWLKNQGHNVLSIYDKLPGALDANLVKLAFAENRILITNYKDFGELTYRKQFPHKGIVLMRLQDERTPNKIKILKNFLTNHSLRIKNNFVVVSETKVRISSQ